MAVTRNWTKSLNCQSWLLPWASYLNSLVCSSYLHSVFWHGILISWCYITVWYCCSHLVTECGVTQFWSAVGIAVATTAVVMFIAGTLAGALLFFCISKHRSQGLKPESSSHEQQQVALSSLQQQKAVSSPYLLKQTGPEYEDVIKLRQNAVYGITLTHTK